MAHLVIGMMAHVDAGKTTLAEAMLYQTGALRKRGRVDHGSAFLDTHAIERERGITVFSAQAEMTLPHRTVTLLDTPGHVDFSAETERTLSVLDYALLLVSHTDGVQAHTRTLFSCLARARVPVILFVNKTDLPGMARQELLLQLGVELGGAFVDFTEAADAVLENAASCDETLMEAYLAGAPITDEMLAEAIAARRLFPVFFGSALRMEGVEALLSALDRYTRAPQYGARFGARVYKISFDGGSRLTWLKVTGGTLRAKALLTNRRAALDGASVWEEKVNELRVYAGDRFTAIPEAEAGRLCAVTGLTRTFPGQGLGTEVDIDPLQTAPVLTYRLLLPEGVDAFTAFGKLKLLEQQDPSLSLVYRPETRQIYARLMGQVQREVLERLILDRFQMRVAFGSGAVLYRETVASAVCGIGHYEPLKHYAHVELTVEPGESGSGVVIGSACSEDTLDRNWQRLILTHLSEKTHRGVLIGAPLTDVRITLTFGRAHLKHTEGGDFRQATYRAVRQALMRADSVLLEPWYAFSMTVPEESLGRVMGDIRRLNGTFDPPESRGGRAVLRGAAPVAALSDYGARLTALTHGEGQLSLLPDGYRPCSDPDAVIAAAGYDPEAARRIRPIPCSAITARALRSSGTRSKRISGGRSGRQRPTSRPRGTAAATSMRSSPPSMSAYTVRSRTAPFCSTAGRRSGSIRPRCLRTWTLRRAICSWTGITSCSRGRHSPRSPARICRLPERRSSA